MHLSHNKNVSANVSSSKAERHRHAPRDERMVKITKSTFSFRSFPTSECRALSLLSLFLSFAAFSFFFGGFAFCASLRGARSISSRASRVSAFRFHLDRKFFFSLRCARSRVCRVLLMKYVPPFKLCIIVQFAASAPATSADRPWP